MWRGTLSNAVEILKGDGFNNLDYIVDKALAMNCLVSSNSTTLTRGNN